MSGDTAHDAAGAAFPHSGEDAAYADTVETAPGVRVRTHPGLCSGHGVCHRFAPDIYPLDQDGHVGVHLLEVPGSRAEDAWRGASVCPERAITVIGPPEQYWIARRTPPTS